MSNLESEITPQVRVMQIICLALAAGPIVFAGFVLATGSDRADDGEPVISLIGYLMAGASLIAGPLIGRAVSRSQAVSPSQPRAITEAAGFDPLCVAYQTGFIISSAVWEGAAFMNIMAYMMEGVPWNLIIAGVLVTLNLVKFPTTAGVADWMRDMQRELDQRN